jgi:hypothetical protein
MLDYIDKVAGQIEQLATASFRAASRREHSPKKKGGSIEVHVHQPPVFLFILPNIPHGGIKSQNTIQQTRPAGNSLLRLHIGGKASELR